MNNKNKNKSICFIVTAEVTATTFLAGYLSYLRAAGWRVTLITSSAGGLEGFARKTGIDAISVRMARNPKPLRDLISLGRLTHAIHRLRPDIVVSATPKAGLLGMVAAKLMRVPTRVYLLWGIRFETVFGIKRWVLKLAEQVAVLSATHVLANSRSLAMVAKRLGIMGKKSAHVLGAGSSHGIDTSRFAPSAQVGTISQEAEEFLSNRSPGTIVIGFVGRIHPDKGIDTLLSGVRLAASGPTKYKLLLVGAIEDESTARRVRDSGLDSYIEGSVADVRPYLLTMDIHCLPSRREGFPNVVLEAGAMAKASIVSDATGVVDSVIDGRTGLIFRTDDSHSLGSAIIRLAEDERLRQEIGENARQHVVDCFAQSKIWQQHELYLRRISAGATLHE